MKLSSIKILTEKALPLLKSLELVVTNQPQSFRYSNLVNFRSGINLLEETKVFENQIKKIKSLEIFGATKDTVSIDLSQGRIFQEKSKELIALTGVFLIALNNVTIEINDERDQNSIFIRLPETSDLIQLSKNISTFNKILSNTILNEKIDGQISLESVEAGSVWLKIYIGSVTAMTVIGSIAWSSAVVYKKYQEARLIEEIVNQKKLETEQKQILMNSSKMLTDLIIEAEAENIYKTFYNSEKIDHEQIERIKSSIKMLSDEFHRGAEINPALTAPENVSNLFPNMKELPSIESKIKKLNP